jgi:hypothetical protein
MLSEGSFLDLLMLKVNLLKLQITGLPQMKHNTDVAQFIWHIAGYYRMFGAEIIQSV